MIKLLCDICGKEIKVDRNDIQEFKYRRNKGIYYKYEAFPNEDMCDDCYNAWAEYKAKVLEKYDKLHEELSKQEREEIMKFIGERNEKTNDKNSLNDETKEELATNDLD